LNDTDFKQRFGNRHFVRLVCFGQFVHFGDQSISDCSKIAQGHLQMENYFCSLMFVLLFLKR